MSKFLFRLLLLLLLAPTLSASAQKMKILSGIEVLKIEDWRGEKTKKSGIDFGTVGEYVETRKVVIQNTGNAALELSPTPSPPPLYDRPFPFAITCSKSVVAPGDTATLFVTADGLCRGGTFSCDLGLNSNIPDEPMWQLYVTSKFSDEDGEHYLESDEQIIREDNPGPYRFIIHNKGATPLMLSIEDISNSDVFVSYPHDFILPGDKGEVRLLFEKAAKPTTIKVKITACSGTGTISDEKLRLLGP